MVDIIPSVNPYLSTILTIITSYYDFGRNDVYHAMLSQQHNEVNNTSIHNSLFTSFDTNKL